MNQAFTEAEIQVLIALIELSQPEQTPNNIGYSFYPKTLDQAASYFRGSRVDWSAAMESLHAAKLLDNGQPYALTEQGLVYARQLRQQRPPLWYWYQDFYTATATSPTHARYCQELFGENLCQDGFMEMSHLRHVLTLLHLDSQSQVLDLGCGNGRIAEHISDSTGACVYGVDYIPTAIQQAHVRTASKQHRLNFRVGNLDCIDFPVETFDALLAVDTLYMPTDLTDTVRQMKAILKPSGQIAIFYSHAVWDDLDQARATLQPDQTPVALALQANDLLFETWDYTQAAYQHARRKQQLAASLRSAFEAEGNGFLSEVQLGEAEGTLHAIEAARYARYLYHVVKPAS